MRYTKKIHKFFLIKESPKTLYEELVKLNGIYNYIVVFPTSDLQLEYLHEIYNEISNYCYLPFNYDNLIQYSNKCVQYKCCQNLGIPYPKTVYINSVQSLKDVSYLKFPILIKPIKRYNSTKYSFRNLYLSENSEIEKYATTIENKLSEGVFFLASEVIPGDGSNIYAYMGYRSKDGKILNEWTGKKLSQYPHDFGVFASASNEASDIILNQGRTLLNGMNLMGIAQPEFKYDFRDGQYKLMEINLRSMMWHRMGNLSGVNIHYTQYLDAIGKKINRQTQEKIKKIHYVYLKFEILNLLRRKNYYRTFFYNILKSEELHFAFFDFRDPRPFLDDTIVSVIVGLIKKVLNKHLQS